MAVGFYTLHISATSFTLKNMHFHIEYVLNVLNWLLITICFLPFESSWGAHPSETDNFIFWFCYEMEARARGEETKKHLAQYF